MTMRISTVATRKATLSGRVTNIDGSPLDISMESAQVLLYYWPEHVFEQHRRRWKSSFTQMKPKRPNSAVR